MDQSRNSPHLLPHLLVVALPGQLVLVLGSLRKTKKNSEYTDQAAKKQPDPEGKEVQEEKNPNKMRNSTQIKSYPGFECERGKYAQSAPKTPLG